jgi:hypothetical protein
MGVRLLPARLRRKACSEPAGCESVEQGAIPWRRLRGAQIGIHLRGVPIARRPLKRPLRGRSLRQHDARFRRRAGWAKRRSDTAVERGSIPRSSTSRTPPGPRPGPLAVGEMATPPVLGTGDRWFDSSRPDLFVARWRSGFLASLMSSRRGFESHPRYSQGSGARRGARGSDGTTAGARRSEGRNVHPASLRGRGMPLAVHGGGWQACRQATDGAGTARATLRAG